VYCLLEHKDTHINNIDVCIFVFCLEVPYAYVSITYYYTNTIRLYICYF